MRPTSQQPRSRGSRRPLPAHHEDPHAVHLPRFEAFLDQARWLLEQQQRRGEAFQQTAVALVGFDGVLLALLVSGGALTSTTRYTAAWWATIDGAGLFVVSAFCGVCAVLPRAISTVPAAGTIKRWQKFRKKGGFNRDALWFADMLLSATPVQGTPSSHWSRMRTTVRRALRRSEPTLQPLEAAERLATTRGLWVLRAGGFLIAGLLSLLLVLLFTSDSAMPRPDETPSVHTGEVLEGE